MRVALSVEWLRLFVVRAVGILGVGLLVASGLAGLAAAAPSTVPAPGAPRGTSTPSPACGPTWQLVASPNVGQSRNVLTGVAAVSSSDVWAVGWYDDLAPDGDALIQHWDGTNWTEYPSPTITRGQLYGVTALAPDDVWAVGIEDRYWTLIEHWDGQIWTRVLSPNNGPGRNALYAIAANSPTDIWAVGSWSTPEESLNTLTMHWDGNQWSIVPSANSYGDPVLFGVAAYASDDVWAVGTARAGGDVGVATIAITLHWDGTTWTAPNTPNPGTLNNWLQAVTMVGPQDVWAVGWYNNNSAGEIGALIEHWNGSSWTAVRGPDLGGISAPLYGIQARSATDVWAVGFRGGASSLALHWDGAGWQLSPNPLGGQLNAVAVTGANEVWAVGWNADHTRIEHYSDPCSTPQPTATGTPPTATPTSSATPSVTGTPPTATPTQEVCGPLANYLISETSGATLEPGTTLVPNSQCDDCVVSLTLPFTVTLYGAQTSSVNLSSNGNLQFDIGVVDLNNVCLPAPNFGATIFAYWDDLNMQIFSCDHCGIFIATVGVAPHRLFNIEWRALHFLGGQAYTNFEIRFAEDAPKQFQLIYGQDDLFGGSATIGVQNADGTRVTQYECNTGGISAGLALTFAQPGCPPPTLTPTLTPTPPASPLPTLTPTPLLSPLPSLTPTPLSSPPPTLTPTPLSSPLPSPTPCVAAFSDVHTEDYFYVPVMYLACHGAISGYSDGTFRPFNNTTRGQLSKIISLAEGWTLTCPGNGHFSDVPPDNPFFCYIETALAHNVVSGYGDGTFRPFANVTRGQVSKIVVLAEEWTDDCSSQHFSDVPPGSTFFCYIETAFAHGLIAGYSDGTFRPNNPATRGQIAKIVYMSLTGPASYP